VNVTHKNVSRCLHCCQCLA